MSSNVTVNTYSYSVTYVTQQMLRSLKEIVRQSGLSLEKILADWESVESAIYTWLGSRDLERVTLEIFNPITNSLMVRWDIDVDYGYSTEDDGSLWTDPDAIRHAIAKAGAVGSTCRYEFLMRTKPGRPDVPGWGKRPYRSTEGFTQHCVGTTIGAGSLASSTSYWRRS